MAEPMTRGGGCARPRAFSQVKALVEEAVVEEKGRERRKKR